GKIRGIFQPINSSALSRHCDRNSIRAEERTSEHCVLHGRAIPDQSETPLIVRIGGDGDYIRETRGNVAGNTIVVAPTNDTSIRLKRKTKYESRSDRDHVGK